MNEFRTLRIFLIPLILILVFFIMTPRMCARRLQRAQMAAPQTVTETTHPSGLQISPSGQEAPRASAAAFPEGLDAARVQYLVEIDPAFSEPKRVTLSRKAKDTEPLAKALLKLQYIEKQADGTWALTREGRLRLEFSETGDSITVQVAKRAFDRVNFMERVEDDKYRAVIQWKWQANEAGEELHTLTMEQPPSWMSKAAQADVRAWQTHTSTAEFTGTGGQWALSSWVERPDDELR